MALGKSLLALGALGAAIPATAAVTVLGNSYARLCYDAAESRTVAANIEAEGYCDRALREENLGGSDTVATLVNRGILKMRRGEIDAAITDFDAAIALDPGEAEAYLNKGMAVLRRPEGAAQAVSLFDEAIARKTRKPAFAYYGRGIAHELGGRIREAYFDFRQASLIEPKWREPRTELARFTVRQP